MAAQLQLQLFNNFPLLHQLVFQPIHLYRHLLDSAFALVQLVDVVLVLELELANAVV